MIALMLRILITAVVILFVVITFKPDFFEGAVDSVPAQALHDFGEGTAPVFRSRLEAGADCAELIAIRDTYDSLSSEVEHMNQELQAIGCHSASSQRVD